ncbi:hypothetical protein [Empedobacter tilapiae]|uniref:hypothetical protein n=1 Tax=Empedobacter tilapiae TaxID=2491114 RepID=UPI0028D66B7F|nr:hypothetical protein [Empedobacter tilapiae]
MIRVSNDFAKAMEFICFKKKQTVTDDELINAVMKFEKVLSKQDGVIFHCLVRNFKNDYANVLFVKEIDNLKRLEENLIQLQESQDFFKLIDEQSSRIIFHKILKDNFVVPNHFSCVECGTFELKNDYDQLLTISESIENEYLNTFENTRAHFIGSINENRFSEITIGETLGKTKEICYGYFNNPFCKQLLEMADETTMELDFWYLIA